jgi:hypothetical protein
MNGPTRCAYAIEPGRRICAQHAHLEGWSFSGEPRRKPGRPKARPNAGRPGKLKPEQRAEIIRRYAAGDVTMAALGPSLTYTRAP